MFVTVKGKVHSDASGASYEIPITLTPGGVLSPLLDYFLNRAHDRSIAWMVKVSRSVRKFLEYWQANPNEQDSYVLFQNFATRLYTGTFTKELGLDPSNLCWRPHSHLDAAHIIRHLTDFFDWLCKERPEAARLNPRYTGGAFDRMTEEAAYQYRRNNAFLGHTWGEQSPSGQNGHRIRARRRPKVETGEPPAFPDDRFEELLVKGFKVGGRHDFRGILITLLLHGAGFRESEPFHLYVSDVFPDPANTSSAMVLIHHPSEGYAPSPTGVGGRTTKALNRATYLANEFALAPRNELMNSHHAGWKGGTHDGNSFKRAYWFLPEYGELFLQAWWKYLEQVARVERSHPFAFINLMHDPLGGMYTLTQYNKAHAAACARIGLRVSKALGTTPHGHRHAYGRRLTVARIEKEFIRRFMHHESLESQEVYTQHTIAETRAALREGALRLQQTHSIRLIARALSCPVEEPSN